MLGYRYLDIVWSEKQAVFRKQWSRETLTFISENCSQEFLGTDNVHLGQIFQGLDEVKVAEHSFQGPMPKSPLLLNYLCFGAHFLQESRLTTEVFMFAFL